MIQCSGIIETPNGTYTDPIINAYFLSYNKPFGILAFPQIMANNYPIDQLMPMVIDGPNSDQVSRADVENSMVLFLESEYPSCSFFNIG